MASLKTAVVTITATRAAVARRSAIRGLTIASMQLCQRGCTVLWTWLSTHFVCEARNRVAFCQRTMAELSPQSTVDVQTAHARIKLARQQLAIRKVQFGPHRVWLSELEGVEAPETAYQLLEFLLSGGESAPYQGEVITEKLTDLAITQARLTDSGKDFLPNSATASRALIKPLLVFLREQAADESVLLLNALSSKIPLLTPEAINRQPEFNAPAAAAAASTKKPAEEQVQTLVSELGGYNYLDSAPNTRLTNKSILLFLDHTSTSISLPRWADLKKGGRAGDLQPLQEEHCNQLVVRLCPFSALAHAHTSCLFARRPTHACFSSSTTRPLRPTWTTRPSTSSPRPSRSRSPTRTATRQARSAPCSTALACTSGSWTS